MQPGLSGELGGRAMLTVVEGDDMQTGEELPLVLVNPLHVRVEHGGWVYLHLYCSSQ